MSDESIERDVKDSLGSRELHFNAKMAIITRAKCMYVYLRTMIRVIGELVVAIDKIETIGKENSSATS